MQNSQMETFLSAILGELMIHKANHDQKDFRAVKGDLVQSRATEKFYHQIRNSFILPKPDPVLSRKGLTVP